MLLKLATHFVIFGIGAGTGVYWGVHHPQAAQSIADAEDQNGARIKAAFAQGQQQALQKVVSDQSADAAANPGTPQATASTSHLDEYKKMLHSAQQQFSDATAKLGN